MFKKKGKEEEFTLVNSPFPVLLCPNSPSTPLATTSLFSMSVGLFLLWRHIGWSKSKLLLYNTENYIQ